jgi:hypothetical protein
MEEPRALLKTILRVGCTHTHLLPGILRSLDFVVNGATQAAAVECVRHIFRILGDCVVKDLKSSC